MPADALARALLDLVLSDSTLPPLINCMHPHEVPWNVFLQAVKICLGSPSTTEVPLSEWVSKVEAIAAKASPDDIERVVSPPHVS